MSGTSLLLLFLRDGVAPPERWLRLRDGAVAARGNTFPPPNEEGERIVAVVPGEDVAIRWVDLPVLAPRQAAAAARLLAAGESAAPVESLHVALGRTEAEAEAERRPMALASIDRMRAWLDQAQALGCDPDHIVPEPMLLAPPPEGMWSWPRGERCIVRGPALAYAAEPELAAQVAGGPLTAIADARVEQGLAHALAIPALDLRQGPFARRRRWRLDASFVRRLAWLAAGIAALVLAAQLVLLLKYSFAAARLEEQARIVAREALPRATRLVDPPAQLRERLAALRGGGLGFTRSASALFAAVRDTPQVELSALRFDEAGTLRATVTAATAPDIAALQQRLDAAGFAVESGGVHPGGGRQIADLTLRPR